MRVLLVDDHPLFLDGLKNLLTSRGVEVVGKARDGLEALDKARALTPDLVLMDIHMPRCDGVAATRQIKAERPEIRIVMLTMSAEDEDLFAAIKSGARGYLLKTLDTEEFFALFHSLAHGEVAFSPGLAARVLQEFAREGRENSLAAQSPAAGAALSPRQVEVLTLVSHGMSYKEPTDDEFEMYNLDDDPRELTNCYGEPGYRNQQNKLSKLLDNQRTQKRLTPCSGAVPGQGCNPWGECKEVCGLQ